MLKNGRHFFIKPSTRTFFNEGRHLEGYSFFDWIHGYIYTRWPYLYIGVATGEHPLSGFFSKLWRFISKIIQFRLKANKKCKNLNYAG